MAFRTTVALGAALLCGTASAALAASAYGPAEIADCVANSEAPGRSVGARDLDAMGMTEYDVKVGRCMQHLDRLYGRQPRPAR
jgi:hypothetical protein